MRKITGSVFASFRLGISKGRKISVVNVDAKGKLCRHNWWQGNGD